VSLRLQAVQALESRAAHLKCTRKGGDAVPLDALVGQLEQIDLAAGV